MKDLKRQLSFGPGVFAAVVEFLMEYGFAQIEIVHERMRVLDGPSPRQTTEILRTFAIPDHDNDLIIAQREQNVRPIKSI